MTISVVTRPKSTDLTLLATVKAELGISISTDDALLETLIDQASGLVETLTNRPMYRAQFSETLKGTMTTRMVLSRLPVMKLDSITYDGSALTLANYSIDNAEAGFVFCEDGFSTTGSPVEYVFTYKAGYLLPGDDVAASTVSVSSSDDSYNDSGSNFPACLVAGDSILVAGYTQIANDGYKTVVSATSAKIIVEESLTTEGAGNDVTFTVRNLPFAVERAAIDLVKSEYQARKRDPAVSSLRVGAVESRWSDQAVVKKIGNQLGKFRITMHG